MGETVLEDSSWMTSAEGQVNLRDRRVESRTSGDSAKSAGAFVLTKLRHSCAHLAIESS